MLLFGGGVYLFTTISNKPVQNTNSFHHSHPPPIPAALYPSKPAQLHWAAVKMLNERPGELLSWNSEIKEAVDTCQVGFVPWFIYIGVLLTIDHPGFHSETNLCFPFRFFPTLASSKIGMPVAPWRVLGLKSPNIKLPVMPWVRWVKAPNHHQNQRGGIVSLCTFSSERKYQGTKQCKR